MLTAPIVQVRKLIKSLPATRQILHQTSKAEERGEPGAKAQRIDLLKALQTDIETAEEAIAATERRANAVKHLALSLSHQTLPSPHPLAHAAHLLGVPAPRIKGLAAAATALAERAEDIATDAQDRLDAADIHIRSTCLLGVFVSKLPEVDFQKDAPKLRALRKQLHSLTSASKEHRQ